MIELINPTFSILNEPNNMDKNDKSILLEILYFLGQINIPKIARILH